MTADENKPDTFELDDSEMVLNLDFYLHRSIIKWQDALESAIREGKVEDGLISRGLAADMVYGCALAKKLIHWEEMPVPDNDEKKREAALKNNKEAKEYQDALRKYSDEIAKKITDKKIQDVKIADFRVFEILKAINKNASKKGKVII